MTESKTKSRTFSRVKKRAISRLVTHYNKKKPAKSHCGTCGTVLSGVALNHVTIKKLSKTQRRPQRPFGGVLCARCSRETLKKRARQ